MGIGNMSLYMSSGVLTHLLRSSTFAKPNGVWLALLSGVPPTNVITGACGGFELANSNSYSRLGVNVADASWAGITQTNGSGTTSNAATLTFTAATTNDWGWVSGVAICDTGTYNGGNVLYYGALSTPKYIGVGDQFTFNANNLQVLQD